MAGEGFVVSSRSHYGFVVSGGGGALGFLGLSCFFAWASVYSLGMPMLVGGESRLAVFRLAVQESTLCYSTVNDMTLHGIIKITQPRPTLFSKVCR